MKGIKNYIRNTLNPKLEYPKTKESSLVESIGDNKHMGLFKHLFQSYGNITSILAITDMLLQGNKKNKYYEFIKKSIPSGLFLYDLGVKINDYYKTNPESHTRKTVKSVLGDDYATYCISDFNFTPDMLVWLVNEPETQNFKILRYVTLHDNKDINPLETEKSFVFGVVIKLKISVIILHVEYHKVLEMYDLKQIYGGYDYNEIRKECNSIYSEYFKSLNYDENVLMFGHKTEVRKRITDIDFNFKTLDFDKIKNNIQTTLDDGNKDAYLITGNPGTGKTSMLLRMEKELSYPIIYVKPYNIENDRTISMLFSTVNAIGKCIVIFEDMDSYDLGDKNKRTGSMLNHLDNSKVKLNVVYVATINDSSGLNYSMLRSGRFNHVIEIDEPNNSNEIYSVMKAHYNLCVKKQHSDYHYNSIPFINKKDLSWFTYWRLKRHFLTQADYCNIVDKLMTRRENFNDKNVLGCRDEILEARKSIKKYDRKANHG